MTRVRVAPRVRPGFLGWRTGTFRPGLWALGWLLWTAFFTLPLLSGWLLKEVFDALSEGDSVNRILLAIGVAEAARWVVFGLGIYFVIRWWVAGLTMFRTNMLYSQTVSGGPHAARLPDSPAEAITRFQDDARDAVIWTDSWLDGLANFAFGAGAFIVMWNIHHGAAVVAFLPLLVVTMITRFLTPRLYAARSADRQAASRVSSFLGETFAGMLAFRLAGREDAAVARLERHTAQRRRTAVRDTVLQEAIDGMSTSTSDFTIGLTLLVLVPAVRSGDFSVGDLALFVAYAVQLGELPRFASRLITAREQAIVSYERMGELLPAGRIDDLVDHCTVTIEPADEMLRRNPDPPRTTLRRLELKSLTATHPTTGGGIRNIDLTIEAGSFVVVTGGVGVGKTTLLRAIVGLVPIDEGEILWNGAPIDDPAAWFVPPNAAHLPQVPRLFSESLADNITLGRSTDDLDAVLTLTTLQTDLVDMPEGLATLVGARGLRLSGGQAQRVATARSLLPRPELLVVDDLSSALDVATERELWTRLRTESSATILAVSHRQLAFDLADRVIELGPGNAMNRLK